jgi:hypothetical protein
MGAGLAREPGIQEHWLQKSRALASVDRFRARHAVGSPASAISTALLIDASDSRASSAAAASVVLLCEPRRHPPGLADQPFRTAAHAPAPAGP